MNWRPCDERWTRWFAWYPVLADDGERDVWVWWRSVEWKEYTPDDFPLFFRWIDYRIPIANRECVR